jgi:putative transposase
LRSGSRSLPSPHGPRYHFRHLEISPEVIRIAVMLYVRFPLSLRNVEDPPRERGIDIPHETVRVWWGRFGQHFAAEIRRGRVEAMRAHRHRRRHLDEMFVKINGEQHDLWRAVDGEGEVLESFVTKRRDKKAALKFPRKALKRHGQSARHRPSGVIRRGAEDHRRHP